MGFNTGGNLYTVSREENILSIIDCHLKNRYLILIIFCTIISGTTGHQMTVQYSTSPNVCFCTTWGKQKHRNMSWNGQKYVKTNPQHYRLWL